MLPFFTVSKIVVTEKEDYIIMEETKLKLNAVVGFGGKLYKYPKFIFELI